jgi:hypothetical protein
VAKAHASWAEAHRRFGLGREATSPLGPASTARPVGQVIGHDRHDRREVDDWRTCLPTISAPARWAPHERQQIGNARPRCPAPGAAGSAPRHRVVSTGCAFRPWPQLEALLFSCMAPSSQTTGGLPVVEELALSSGSKRETIARRAWSSACNSSIVLRASSSFSRNESRSHSTLLTDGGP